METLENLSTHTIRELTQVGRYAVGVKWGDGHESIYPLDTLRRHCPCLGCRNGIQGELPEDCRRLQQLVRLGDVSVFLAWCDGHETIYRNEQLRSLCRCAYCAGEPERPITGG